MKHPNAQVRLLTALMEVLPQGTERFLGEYVDTSGISGAFDILESDAAKGVPKYMRPIVLGSAIFASMNELDPNEVNPNSIAGHYIAECLLASRAAGIQQAIKEERRRHRIKGGIC